MNRNLKFAIILIFSLGLLAVVGEFLLDTIVVGIRIFIIGFLIYSIYDWLKQKNYFE